jgi:undecaprenyl diphosphate synthase
MKKDEKKGVVPRHIAIIMDGNGRWAKARLMPRSFGHQQGFKRMMDLLEHAYDIGVESVTVYALSTENLNRPQEELNGLFNLVRNHFLTEIKRICAKGARMHIIGELSMLPQDIQDIVHQAEAETACYEGRHINVALAYGSRAEIVHAVNALIAEGKPITEENISKALYTGDQPEPDLIIRTGKEKRLSNFLLYQGAYSELYFSDKMFPEFSDEDLDEAVAEYARRTRRFGKTDEQI